MTMYEILKLNKGLFEFMIDKDVQPADVRYLRLYSDYLQMEEEYKKTYIVALLMDKYSVSEATVYRVLRRFKRVIA